MADPARLLPFAPEEYEDRLDGLREAMEVHGLDACVLTSPRALAYYAGLAPAGDGFAEGLVVTRQGSLRIGPARAAARLRLRAFGDVLTYDEGARDAFWQAAASVTGTGKAIGCEADHLTLMQSEKLTQVVQPRRGVDVALAMMQQRMIKSEAELALIRTAAGVADLGLAALIAGHGARQARRAMEDEIARLLPGAEDQAIRAFADVDGSGAALALTASAELHHYTASAARLRGPSEASQALAALQAQGAALIRPGVSCGDLARGLQALAADLGLGAALSGDFGGGMAGEPILALRADCETVLEPGMVIRLAPLLMPSPGRPGAGVQGLQDLVLVTETGAEVMTGLTSGLGPEEVV